MSKLLKPMKGKGSPSSVIFFDTETLSHYDNEYEWGEEAQLWFGWAIHCRYEKGKETRRDKIFFRHSDDFWKWVLTKTSDKKPTWIVAHNLGFDLTTTKLWNLIDKDIFRLTSWPNKKGVIDPGIFVMDDPPTIIQLHTPDRRKLICVDSMNYWPTSLAKIGESVGYPKLEMPPYSDGIITEEWSKYCLNDVEVLAEAFGKLLSFIEEQGYGGLTMSAPSLAMRTFRTRFQKRVIHLHRIQQVSDLERASYFGGRLEAYRIGTFKESVHKLDITSLYPSVMRVERFPYELVDFQPFKPEGYDQWPDFSIAHTATILIHTDTDTYPLKTKEGVIFPIGRYVTTLAGPELVRAKIAGHIERVYAWNEYLLADIFQDMATHFLEQRSHFRSMGNEVYATFCKLLINSFYGKWGQCNPTWEYCGETEGKKRWEVIPIYSTSEGTYSQYRCMGNRMEKRKPKGEGKDHPNSFAAIASYVTSYGRERMRLLCEMAGWKNLAYLVTDGILVNERGYKRLLSNNEIRQKEVGYLEYVKGADDFAITALHQYRVGDEITRGAIKPSAIQLPNGYWMETHFEGLKTLLSKEKHDGVKIYPIVKKEPCTYLKGEVLSSGRVIPWKVTSLNCSSIPSIGEILGTPDAFIRQRGNANSEDVLAALVGSGSNIVESILRESE